MRTLYFILGGVAAFAIVALIARATGGEAARSYVLAAKIFIPLWLVVAAVNMVIGVARAGYSIGEELPIFLALFAIPAAVVLAAARWLR